MKLTAKYGIACFVLFFCLITASPLASVQTKEAMEFEDIMSLRAASDPRISPNAGFVAFVVTQADMKTNVRNSDVWLVAAYGGQPRQITFSPKRDDSPQWSPDSRHIAF